MSSRLGGAVAAFGLPATLPAFLVVAAVVGAIDGDVSPLQKGVLTRRSPKNVRGGIISFNAVIQNLGKTIAPVTLGALIATVGVRGAFPIAGAGVAVLGVVVLLVILRAREPSPG